MNLLQTHASKDILIQQLVANSYKKKKKKTATVNKTFASSQILQESTNYYKSRYFV